MTSPNEQFLSIINTMLGVNLSAVVMDGSIHRFDIKKTGGKVGWYCGFIDNLPAGSFGSWQTGESHTWCAKGESQITPQEGETNRLRFEQAAKAREALRLETQKEAASKAVSIWQSASQVNENHPYLAKKCIQPHGLRQSRDALVVPVRIGGELTSLQFIKGARLKEIPFRRATQRWLL